MTPRKHKGRFSNPHEANLKRSFRDVLLWVFGYYNDPSPPSPLPSHFSFPNPKKELKKDQPKLLWIGHSTFWIQLGERGVLVDPIWSKRCSPLPFFGPKRHLEPGIEIDKLPCLDYVILSHDHYDHMDRKSIIKIYECYPHVSWITPIGVKKRLHKFLPSLEEKRVVELSWWEEYEKEELKFTSVPAQHFSGRGLFDLNCTLWMGCIVQGRGKTFYFAGDTGYNTFDFKKIGEKFRSIDLSILPIGVYSPRKFMQPVHIHPEESFWIHREVGSKLSVGGHFGTFKLSPDALTRPPYDLYEVLQKEQCSWEEFRVLQPGQWINW